MVANLMAAFMTGEIVRFSGCDNLQNLLEHTWRDRTAVVNNMQAANANTRLRSPFVVFIRFFVFNFCDFSLTFAIMGAIQKDMI